MLPSTILYLHLSFSSSISRKSNWTPPPIMLSVSLLSTLLLSTCVLAAPIEKRTPPGIPTTAAAKTALAGLTVAAQGPQVSFPSRMMLHCSPAPGALQVCCAVRLTEEANLFAQTGYSRDLFPTWITISGTCNTRETVLKRDGTNVVTSSACAATSGSWYSPYDGATVSPEICANCAVTN